MMKKLFSLFAAVLFAASMWGTLSSPYTCTFTASMTESDNQVTTGDVTWTLARTVGKGSPTTSFGNQNGQTCIKLGSGKNNYYSLMKFTTSAFTNYNVTKVVIYISSNNGGSKTITVKQGSTTIGSKSQSFSSTTWVTNSTYNSTSGSGGDLEISISSDATATFVHSIEVTYTVPTYAVTITNPTNGTVSVKDGDDPVVSGTSFAPGKTLTVTAAPTVANAYRETVQVLKTSNSADVTASVLSGSTLTVPGYPITVTATEEALFAVNIAVNDANMGSATINGGTSTVYASENDVDIALVATPKSGYEFVNWTVTTGDEDDITITSATSASTTAGLVTGAVTVTANFQAQSCTNLAAPTLDAVTKTYNSATIAWNAVTNAEGYVLNIKQGTTSIVEDELIDAPTVSFTKNGLNPETQYSYTVMAYGDGQTYCDESNPLLEGNFTTDELSPATLTLSENGATHNLAGDHKLNDVVTLPSDLDNDANKVDGKVFVGWDANASCTSKPTYAPGAEYTLAAKTQTLYAVYGEITGDEAPVLAQTLQWDTWSYSGTTTNMSSDKYRLFAKDAYVESANLDLSILAKVNVYAGTYGSITPTANKKVTINAITDATTTWASCALSTNKATTLNEVTSEVALTGTGKLRIVAGGGDGSSTGIRLSKVEIFTQEPLDTTNYATTGKKAAQVTVNPTQLTLNATAVSNVVTVTTVNVDDENLAVALFNDEDCTDAFDGGWLTASINGDNNIAYSATAPTSYANKRTAYIQLTAPAEDDGVADVVVVIKATQNQKPANFDSFEALQASDLPRTEDGTSGVKVTFSNVAIHSISNGNVELDIKDTEDDTKYIQIYNSTSAPSSWDATGSVSGTQLTGKWKLYNGAMEFVITDWSKVDYNAPSFASFEALVAASLDDEKLATVSFTKVSITELDTEYGGIYLNVKGADDKDVEIYPAIKDLGDFAVGGLVSGTITNGTWNHYSSGWAIEPQSGFAWSDLTYTPTYQVTIAATTNGSITIKKGDDAITSGDYFEENTILTVTANPAVGFKLNTLTTNGTDIKSAMSFTVGTAAVEVAATFSEDTGTGIDNTEAEVKAVKIIENGQMFIIKNGRTFNAQGQLVK